MTLLYSLLTGLTSLLGKETNTSSVLLLNFVVLFVLMVLGGLIYPSYSQTIRFTTGNPAWLTQLLADGALTGELHVAAWPIYLLTIAGSFFVTMTNWRKRL